MIPDVRTALCHHLVLCESFQEYVFILILEERKLRLITNLQWLAQRRLTCVAGAQMPRGMGEPPSAEKELPRWSPNCPFFLALLSCLLENPLVRPSLCFSALQMFNIALLSLLLV